MLCFNLSKQRFIAPTTGYSNQRLVTQQKHILCNASADCSTISAVNTKDTSSNATTEKRNDNASLTHYSRNLKCATTDFTKRQRITPTPPTADNRLHQLVQLLNSTGIRFISQNPQNSLD
ncbi:hypothetical protein F511_29101 [Dorcoceras hygrometricum]|uniref:Uncharacterized protein n=1 Tax=Dorcoceras hygrometricum TaxID=472368 RepID=A0A2Z7C725_9LAMI|nr:hypothetical protein F511_29101 [Dorcoceras hygrometricum]